MKQFVFFFISLILFAAVAQAADVPATAGDNDKADVSTVASDDSSADSATAGGKTDKKAKKDAPKKAKTDKKAKTVSEKAKKDAPKKDDSKKDENPEKEESTEETDEAVEWFNKANSDVQFVFAVFTFGIPAFIAAWLSSFIIILGGSAARSIFGFWGDLAVWVFEIGLILSLFYNAPTAFGAISVSVWTVGVIAGIGLGIVHGFNKVVSVA